MVYPLEHGPDQHRAAAAPQPFQLGAVYSPIVFERVDQPRPCWEYRVITVDPRREEPLSEARLNELGQDGWLLAGAPQHSLGAGTALIAYYFVRAAA